MIVMSKAVENETPTYVSAKKKSSVLAFFRGQT
jgi:hypothetical protein